MRSLDHAKQRAREIRAQIGTEHGGLFERVKEYLYREYRIRVRAVAAHEINDNEAELSVFEREICYVKSLDADPVGRLLVVAHEMGHLVLHKRLTDQVSGATQLLPSIYLGTGAPALARYNSRAREELEADAFAKEFACPGGEIFERWLRDRSATSKALAAERGLPLDFIRVQLVEGLSERALENSTDVKGEPRRVLVDDETQVKAATHVGSPALVNAGPGTGKTSTLVMRIEHLRREKGARAKNMLVLTFSNEAADELRERLAEKFGVETASEMEITTFHSYGYSFLLKYGQRIGLDEKFTVLDEARQEEIIKGLLGSVDCDAVIDLKQPEVTARQALRQICRLKERGVDPNRLEEAITRWEAEEPDAKTAQARSRALLSVFREYERVKTGLGAVDFADLITMPLGLLERDEELTAGLRDHHKWVMVDEYQDVSRAVAMLLGRLCGKNNPPWVVGDLRQAIYLFCGAAPQNVSNFPDDFRGAKVFELETNYRSCDEVIDVANQLAELMECPGKDDGAYPERWRRGTDTKSRPGPGGAVVVAQADSDDAEYEGIAGQVKAWLKEGVSPSEIAVLARRNVDVRNITLELGKREVKATTSGLITPEGAAGDLAAVATFIDGRSASLPRVVYALGRETHDKAVLNDILFHLHEVVGSGGGRVEAFPEAKTLLDEVARLDECLEGERGSGDAFAVICAFLFDGTDYLRRSFSSADESKRSLVLSEIITALAAAAAYRASHAGVTPKASRVGFGEYFRANLSAAKPVLVPPRAAADCVRVMTCHASKGLEFPCVSVAGQTLPLAKDPSWLPPKMEATEAEERAQADALFFVAATRAQCALLVSFAKTKKRTVTPLLERWVRTHNAPLTVWESGVSEWEEVWMEAVWGGRPRGKLPATALSSGNCGIRVYLEQFLGIRFPATIESLYPRFFVTVRLALETIVRRSQEEGRRLTADEGEQVFLRAFPNDEPLGHPHYEIYRRRGAAYAGKFAQAYEPRPRALEFFDTEELINRTEEELLPLRLDLVTYYRDETGQSRAILFRPESFEKKSKNGTELSWSNVESTTRKRMAFVLLRKLDAGLRPGIYSGEDGIIYDYKWNRNTTTMDEDAARARARLGAFSRGRFETVVEEFMCDNKCQCRVPCPFWMKAL